MDLEVTVQPLRDEWRSIHILGAYRVGKRHTFIGLLLANPDGEPSWTYLGPHPSGKGNILRPPTARPRFTKAFLSWKPGTFHDWNGSQYFRLREDVLKALISYWMPFYATWR